MRSSTHIIVQGLLLEQNRPYETNELPVLDKPPPTPIIHFSRDSAYEDCNAIPLLRVKNKLNVYHFTGLFKMLLAHFSVDRSWKKSIQQSRM